MERGAPLHPRLATIGWLAVIVGALHFARDLVLPVALAALLSLLLLPMVRGLERLGWGRILSILTVAVAAIVLLGSISWILTRQMADLGRKLPEYRGRIIARANTLGPVGRVVKEVTDTLRQVREEVANSSGPPDQGRAPPEVRKVEIVQRPPGPLEIMGGALVAVVGTLGTTVLIGILVIFFLVYHVDLRDRLIHLIGDRRVPVTAEAMTDAARGVSRYLFLQSGVNGSFGLVVTLGLLALDVPNALLWGLLAALLRFIPYIGTWLAAAMPFALSVAVFEGWSRPLWLLAGWTAVEIVVANVLEPWVYGARTGLSPMAVILAAFFWTWVWGGVGLLLAIPLTVSLVVLGKHLPQLSFFYVLFGSDAPLSPRVQLYYRLLASDDSEALELVDRFRKDHSVAEAFDGLFLPALCRVEEDRRQERLDDVRANEVLKDLRDLIQDVGERAAPEKTPGPGDPLVLCLPAARASDEIALQMLAPLLGEKGWRTEVASERLTAGEKVERIETRSPRLVLLSSVWPGTPLQTRYLYKRIRRQFPHLEVRIGLWGAAGDPSALSRRVAPDGEAKSVRTLAEAVEETRQVLSAPEAARRV